VVLGFNGVAAVLNKPVPSPVAAFTTCLNVGKLVVSEYKIPLPEISKPPEFVMDPKIEDEPVFTAPMESNRIVGPERGWFSFLESSVQAEKLVAKSEQLSKR
jgi:hypothetical protein